MIDYNSDSKNSYQEQDTIQSGTEDISLDGCDSEGRNVDGIPSNFKLTCDSVLYVKDDNERTEELVCSRLEVIAQTFDERGENWGRMLVITDRKGKQHVWAMPMEMLAGDGSEYRKILLSKGLTLAPGKSAKDRLHQYLSQAKPKRIALAVSRLGWHEEVFVFPDAIIDLSKTRRDGSGPEQIIFQAAHVPDHAFREKDTLEEWKTNVAALCIGNTRLLFAVSCAFASPLLYVTGDESGGFHFLGNSSTGKTTALIVAGSVWGGGGLHGYISQWRATANELEAVAALHCDTLLCLDEMSQVSGYEAGEIAYLLANGQGKTRAWKDSSARATAAWRILFLSTGEITLADKISEEGRRRPTAGQRVRILDIPADAQAGLGIFENLHDSPAGDDFAERLKREAKRYYGTPSRAFLEGITADTKKVRDAVRTFRERFVEQYCPGNADGQVKRAAARFGLVAAAGEFAIALGIVPWPKGEAERAAVTCFEAWLAHRGHAGSDEIEVALGHIRKFFELHGESRFTPWEEGKDSGEDNETPRKTIYRAGFKRSTKDGFEYYVLPEVFNSEMCAGFNPKSVAKESVERGFIIPDSKGKTTSSHRLPGIGQKRVYRFSSRILAGDSEQGRSVPRESKAQHFTDTAIDTAEADLFISFRSEQTPARHKPAISPGNSQTQVNENRVSQEGGRKCKEIQEFTVPATQETLETQKGELRLHQDEKLRAVVAHPQEFCRCTGNAIGAAECPVIGAVLPYLETLRESWPKLAGDIVKEVEGTGERCVCQHAADALHGQLLKAERDVQISCIG